MVRKRNPRQITFADLRGEKEPSADAVSLGRQAQHAGESLETWLSQHARVHLPQVTLVHVPAKWGRRRLRSPELRKAAYRAGAAGAVMSDGSVMVTWPEQSTWVDFIALLDGGGCAHFDAKTCSSSASSWVFAGKDRPVISPHQDAMLRARSAHGDPCFIYLRHFLQVAGHPPWDDYVLPYVPGEGLPWANTSSIAWTRLSAWKVPPGTWCWLDACSTAPRWSVYLADGWAGLIRGYGRSWIEARIINPH